MSINDDDISEVDRAFVLKIVLRCKVFKQFAALKDDNLREKLFDSISSEQ